MFKTNYFYMLNKNALPMEAFRHGAVRAVNHDTGPVLREYIDTEPFGLYAVPSRTTFTSLVQPIRRLSRPVYDRTISTRILMHPVYHRTISTRILMHPPTQA